MIICSHNDSIISYSRSNVVESCYSFCVVYVVAMYNISEGNMTPLVLVTWLKDTVYLHCIDYYRTPNIHMQVHLSVATSS